MQARADGVLSFKQARHEEQTVGTVTDISQGMLACVRFPYTFPYMANPLMRDCASAN